MEFNKIAHAASFIFFKRWLGTHFFSFKDQKLPGAGHLHRQGLINRATERRTESIRMSESEMPGERRNKVCSLSAGSPRSGATTCPFAKRVALPRVICRDETRRDKRWGRDRRGHTPRETADEEKQRPPRSQKLNPPT